MLDAHSFQIGDILNGRVPSRLVSVIAITIDANKGACELGDKHGTMNTRRDGWCMMANVDERCIHTRRRHRTCGRAWKAITATELHSIHINLSGSERTGALPVPKRHRVCIMAAGRRSGRNALTQQIETRSEQGIVRSKRWKGGGQNEGWLIA
jgi:hypothetical protein